MKKLFSLYSSEGSIGRLEYLLSTITVTIIFFGCALISVRLDKMIGMEGYPPFVFASIAIFIWGKICAIIKRLNDLVISKACALLLFVPLANIFMVILLLFQKRKEPEPVDQE